MTTATRLYPDVKKSACCHEIIGEENRRYRMAQGRDFICGKTATIAVDGDHYCAQHAKIAAGGQANLIQYLKRDSADGKNHPNTTWLLFQINHGLWSEKTFGNRSPIAPLRHLAAEVQETIDAPDDITEYADCMMLLLDAARIAGFTTDDLFSAMVKKLKINKARKWGKPNAQGFTEHIKETA